MDQLLETWIFIMSLPQYKWTSYVLPQNDANFDLEMKLELHENKIRVYDNLIPQETGRISKSFGLLMNC